MGSIPIAAPPLYILPFISVHIIRYNFCNSSLDFDGAHTFPTRAKEGSQVFPPRPLLGQSPRHRHREASATSPGASADAIEQCVLRPAAAIDGAARLGAGCGGGHGRPDMKIGTDNYMLIQVSMQKRSFCMGLSE
ncbi:MAG: hypothetical protein ABIR84_05825 [Candidatus Nitrotoga sp.]